MAAVVGAAANPVIKVAAVCGSLRKGSYNLGLIRAAIQLSKESVKGLQIEQIDISPLPMINTDLEVNGTFPPVVEDFRQRILKADCILFASPEYNYSVAAPLKNAIDWASRPPNCWADKAAAIVSAGGGFGGGRSQYHLRQIGVYLDLHFINKPEFFVKAFEPPAKFDSEGNLIDPQAKERLKEVLSSLCAFTLRLKDMNSASSVFANLNSVPLLSSSNFKLWKRKVETALCCMNKDLALYKDCPKEPDLESSDKELQAFEDWQQSSRVCRLVILSAVPMSMQSTLDKEASASKILEILARRYTHTENAEISDTIRKFSTIKYRGDSDIREYVQEIINLAEKLKALKVELPDDYLVHHVLASLPPQYSQFEVSYNCQANKWTIDQLTVHLVQEQERLRHSQLDSDHLATASSSDLKKRKGKETAGSGSQKKHKGSYAEHKGPKCFFCKKVGHFKKDCAKYKT